MERMMSFGEQLRHYRELAGLTQEQLAEQAGLTPNAVGALERGERQRPYPNTVRLLATALKLSEAQRAALLATLHRRSAAVDPQAPAVAVPQPPPLRLPTYLTPFVGREREQAEIVRLLATPDHRLISLVGPGGIGKTRLAVEVARQAAGFADDVVFVPLAPIRQPHAIVPAIADALAFTFSGTTDLVTQLLTYLRDQELLIVLDNLEHLLGAEDITVGLVRKILAQAPGVKLLTTSRERLKLQAEWVVEIAGLPVPPEDMPQAITDYPSFTLFLEHAQRVQHGLSLSADDEHAIAEICRLVGGMPLGLELAAAWVRVLSPQEIGQEIIRGLDAPLVSPQDLPERHRSLQAVFEQSWHLLSAAEQCVLRKLAVFRGGCTREAAAEVAGASLAVLATLVDKSLLRRTTTGRYDLHEVIRQYALAKLQQDQQEYVATRDQHSAYYAAWLKLRERPLKGAQQAAMVAELSVEIDNIRAAWEWAVEHRRWWDIQRSAETLHWFYEFRSWFQEGEALFRRASDTLSRPPSAPNPPGDTVATDAEAEHGRVLGQVLAVYGYLASRFGQMEVARTVLERSLALLQRYDDPVAVGRALAYFGIVTCHLGDYSRSRQALLEGLRFARAGADEWTVANCLTWLSTVEHALGAYDDAERAFREGLAVWRAIGNPRTTLFCITFCSITLFALNKYSEAHALLHESLALSQTTDDRWGMAMTLTHLGLIASGQQEYHEAVRLFREALALLQRCDDPVAVARALTHLGTALLAIGTVAEAEQAYREALTTAMAAQAIPDLLHALVGLATVRTHEHNYEGTFELVVHIQQHAASRTETRTQAAHLCAVILPHLSQQQIEAITERVRSTSLAEAVRVLLWTR